MTEKRPDVAVCRCRVEIEEVDTEARRHTVSESFYNAPYTGMHVLDDELRVKMSVVLWNKIFAKELIERYGICFPEGCEHIPIYKRESAIKTCISCRNVCIITGSASIQS